MNDTLATKTDLKAEIKNFEHRLTVRLGALMVIFTGVTLAILRFLPPAA